jgi:hypothetical protein
MNTIISIPVVFHILTNNLNLTQTIAEVQAQKIIDTLNNDFNNYSTDYDDVTTNNFAYISIINEVFLNSPIATTKLEIYESYLSDRIPTEPANIEFSIGQIYFYPIEDRLYTDSIDENYQNEVRLFILNNEARHIQPDLFLNIWIVDTNNQQTLAFSSFPWEDLDDGTHGLIIHLRIFYPELYGLKDNYYNLFRTVTHEVGHWMGLLHVFASDGTNPDKIDINSAYGVSDPLSNTLIQNDPNYNPLFMNFMDYTYDKYMAIFTINQIRKIRYILNTYRPKIFQSIGLTIDLPVPQYFPGLNNDNQRIPIPKPLPISLPITGTNRLNSRLNSRPNSRRIDQRRREGKLAAQIDTLNFVEQDVNFTPILGTQTDYKVPAKIPYK